MDVKWHEGRLFTAQDVKCTWKSLLGLSADKAVTPTA
jgi:ABC-type transport system substrate-binding protein